MGPNGYPSPPIEASKVKKQSHTKSTKPTNRASKRANSTAAAHHHHDIVVSNTSMQDSRHKRVWKACERCRMKKTKCDGEFPCKRCKDDGLVCTAGLRKKVEYKQLPRGYAEVLENTQLTLVATVHKLYSMVRNGQSWDLGEPDLNDHGLPIVHNIADKLGCIRPNGDIDLPVHSVFPEDEAGMAELATQLEEQQHHSETTSSQKEHSENGDAHHDRASSSEGDHSDLELDYRKLAFGRHNMGNSNNGLTLSPQSYAGSHDFDFSSSTEFEQGAMFASPSSSSLPNFSNDDWSMPKSASDANALAMQFLQQSGGMQSIDLLGQGAGLLDAEFGAIKPDMMAMTNNEVMMGLGDPMIYSSFDNEMRL